MTVHSEKMLAAIDPAMLATDLADYLVRRGIPFREAHAAAGKAVRRAAEKDISLEKLSLNEWQSLGAFESDVYQVFDPLESVKRRNATGGTSPDSVKKQIEKAKSTLTQALSQRGRKQKGE
jgi:argininosuccinate lyase